MSMNALAVAAALSDQDLLSRIESLAGREREATVDLIAHLAELELRPSLYAGAGYGSLFGYCVQALHLSEDATCNRIAAARLARRFPAVLDLLASGALTLASIRLIGPHLTPDNCDDLLARASGRRRHDLEALVAELAPRPDVPSTIRKLPAPRVMPAPAPVGSSAPSLFVAVDPDADSSPATDLPAASPPVPPPTRPIVQATAPDRFRVQFTIGAETRDKLRRLQDLLRTELPSGDPSVLFDRGITLLLETVERRRLGRHGASPRIRRAADNAAEDDIRTPPLDDPYIPLAVRRAVWARDGGRCAYVSKDGRRCTECSYIEFHHVVARALGGRATVENIALRCRRHNQYESEVLFGPRVPPRASGDGITGATVAAPPST
jgi:hypothetical protein